LKTFAPIVGESTRGKRVSPHIGVNRGSEKAR
jgi:hypothetical protein